METHKNMFIVILSPCGYYKVHQFAEFWVEYYANTSGGWSLQEDTFEEGKQSGRFNGYEMYGQHNSSVR